MRGEWSQERIDETLKNHERAEKRLKEHKEEVRNRADEMRKGGASPDEINQYYRSRDKELKKLVKAWRSLDGLPE
jgi:GTP1/Obg family GTP-binding protein